MTNPSSSRQRRWLVFVALFTIHAMALWFRVAGLSHGLEERIVYHPDTPKQAMVAERFLKGEYFLHVGNPDYDGYPFFSSLITSVVFQTWVPAVNAVSRHMGRTAVITPDRWTILWTMRILNVLFSMGIVWGVYSLGRRIGAPLAGLLAALFAALSPLAIISCHYGMSDSPVSFFALMTVLFSVHAYSRGRYMDYAAAGVAGAFAFAAKYHGGLVVIPFIVAHACRYPGWRLLRERGAWLRLAVAGVSSIGGVIAVTPAFWVNPDQALDDLWAFFGRVSTFGMGFLSDMNVVQRMWFSLGHNWYAFEKGLSLPGILLLSVGVVMLPRWKKDVWILVSLPLGYILVGLTLKPLSDPQYHTIATHVIFLLLALVIVRIARCRSRLVGLPVAVAMALLVSVLLARVTLEQTFFFKHTDTRRIATQWHAENIPSTCAVDPQRYTILYEGARTGAQSTVSYRLGVESYQYPSALTYTFDMGDSQFTLFRNPPISVSISPGPFLRPGWRRPIFMFMPSQPPLSAVLSDQPCFVASPRVRILEPDREQRFTLVSPDPITNLWIVVKCGRFPSEVQVTAADQTRVLRMRSSQTAALTFPLGRPSLVSHGGRSFYPLRMSSTFEQVRLQICTDADEYVAALLNAGMVAEASHIMETTTLNNPVLHSMMQSIGGGAEATDTQAVNLPRRGSMLLDYGVSAAFYNKLPGFEFSHKHLGVLRYGQSGDGLHVLPAMFLERGVYAVEVCMDSVDRPEVPPMTIVSDRTLQPLSMTATGHENSLAPGCYQFKFTMPSTETACRLVLDRTFSPDAFVSATCRVAAYASLHAATCPPKRGHDASRLLSVPGGPEYCSAEFEHGLKLTGWRLAPQPEVRAGTKLLLHCYWDVKRPTQFLREVGVWVHFVDAEGKISFQGDRALMVDLPLLPTDGLVEGVGAEISVPEHVQAGTYSVRVGLFIPMQSRQLKLKASTIPSVENGVVLGSVQVASSCL